MQEYALLDAGDGRRLERFGTVIADRPAPAALQARRLSAADWARADLRFEHGAGWTSTAPDDWAVRLGPVVLGLAPAAAGQIGVFPEHADVCTELEAAAGQGSGLRVLSLFAHTGLATLRLAALPFVAQTVHVDASAGAVRRARANADLSGLADKPIRWITDDAVAFVAREGRRGNVYDLIVADPPAFGRGPAKTQWKLEKNLPGLLAGLQGITAPGGRVCLTCHPAGRGPEWLGRLAADACPDLHMQKARRLSLRAQSGAQLPCGLCCMFIKEL